MSREKVEVVRRGIWLAVLVLLALAASASALPLRKIGPGSVWTDGARYAVFFPAEQAWWPTQVFDERAGRRYTVNPPTVPPAPGFLTPPICRFYAVAGGSVLWSCPFGEPPYLLTELATGVTHSVPGWHKLERSLSRFEDEPDVLGPGLRGFGRRWLHIQLYERQELLANRWLDWRTGTLVKNEPGGARDVIDLDDPRLAVPLCEPLRRRIERSGGSGLDIVIPYVYEHGWLFDPSYSVQFHAVKIHRCGRRRPLILHRCRHFCSSASFGAGYVTWLDEKKFSIFDPTPISRAETAVFAYDVRRHRRFGFRANFGLQWPLYLWHTRKHVYAHTAYTAFPSPTLYVGRLPERR